MSGTRVRPPPGLPLQWDGLTGTLRSSVDRCVIILSAFPDLKTNVLRRSHMTKTM